MAQAQQATNCHSGDCCEATTSPVDNLPIIEPVAPPTEPFRPCCSHNHNHHISIDEKDDSITADTKIVNGDKAADKTEKTRKDSLKGRTKEDPNRSIENIVKALHTLKTPEEKLAAICKKYTDLLEEHRAAQLLCKQHERKCLLVTKEKEQLQADYSKTVLARSRLEGLCRELQRQCKITKDECHLRVKEEEDKRKETSTKFQTTLAEISNMMTENNQKNSVLREENMELSAKLKNLVDQYELREQHVDKLLKHKELEMQLSEARLAKSNIVLSEDKEKHLREKQKLLQDLTEYQRKCTDMATNEVQLRAQLGMYTDKYSEFQETLTKSNQVFTSFKGEMEKMSKKIKKLEKETGTWKTRWENSNRALLEMAEDKQKHHQELASGQKKIAQLEKLCRALQAERTGLLQQLASVSTAGIKPPTLPIADGVAGVTAAVPAADGSAAGTENCVEATPVVSTAATEESPQSQPENTMTPTTETTANSDTTSTTCNADLEPEE